MYWGMESGCLLGGKLVRVSYFYFMMYVVVLFVSWFFLLGFLFK